MAVVANVVKATGECSLGYVMIAKKAGVGRTTAQSGMKLAVALGHLHMVRRAVEGDTNVLTINFDAWTELVIAEAAEGR